MSDVQPKIVINKLNKVFLKKKTAVEALKNINVTINEGEFVCLLGPSGCGKTTLLRILAGLETASAGEFKINPGKKNRPLQSMIFQEKGVIPWLTTAQNVAFGLNMRGMPKQTTRERVNYYLEKTGLLPFKEHYAAELSGGMKQRVSIARAFANDPEILLMDEPFAALDEQNKFILQQELLDIWEETGKTVLFITHSIDEALLLSDRILLMSAQPGEIAAEKKISLERRLRKMETIRSDPAMQEIFTEIWQHLQETVTDARD